MGAHAIPHTDSSDAGAPLAQRVDWLGLGFRVPAQWEIVRHSTNPERGVLAFVDRRMERLRVSWTACQKPPDLGRLITDFSRAEGREPLGAPWQRRDGARGFSSRGEAGLAVRAVRYDLARKRLLELTLSAEGMAAPEARMHALLDSLELAPQAAFSLSAFGLHVSGPAELSLASATVRAMDARIGLALGASGSVSVRRLGAADIWFAGDYRAWLSKHEPSLDYRSFTSVEQAGHPALSATGFERRPLLQRVLRRVPVGESVLWACPLDNALYVVTSVLAAGTELTLSSVRVACCHGEGRDA